MPTQKKPAHTGSQSKTKKEALPERNIIAEIFIQVGALAMLAYAIMLVLYGLVVIAFNDTGSAAAGPIALLIFLFCINVTVQAVKLLRQSNRVDHYRQRIIAICLILLLPIVMIVSQTVASNLSMSKIRPADDTSIAQIFNGAMIAGVILGVVGSILLWVLLKDKNKLVWILKSSNTKSTEFKKTKEKFAKSKKIGLIFLLAPVILFAFSMFVTIFVGSMGNAGTPIWLILMPFQHLLGYLWLPSVVVGIIILARRK